MPQATIVKAARFTLRPFRKSDLPSLATNINDPGIAANTLTIPYPYKLRDAEDWYKRYKKHLHRNENRRMAFAIVIDGEAAGSVGISLHDHKAELGYWLARKYWGQGIMTEAVRETCKYCFRELGLRRLYAHVFPNNKASMRVLKKAGFKFEGVLRKNVKKGNRLIDEYLFARVK